MRKKDATNQGCSYSLRTSIQADRMSDQRGPAGQLDTLRRQTRPTPVGPLLCPLCLRKKRMRHGKTYCPCQK